VIHGIVKEHLIDLITKQVDDNGFFEKSVIIPRVFLSKCSAHEGEF